MILSVVRVTLATEDCAHRDAVLVARPEVVMGIVVQQGDEDEG